MKRILSLALAAALSLGLLASCGGNNAGSSAPAAPAAANVDLAAFVESLSEKYGENFPANMDLTDPDMADMLEMCFPGLSEIPVKQLVARQPMMSAVVCELVAAELEDASQMDAFKGILQARIDAQVDGGAWYPESIEGWQNNSRIVTNGNYILMIVWHDCDEVVDAFNALF